MSENSSEEDKNTKITKNTTKINSKLFCFRVQSESSLLKYIPTALDSNEKPRTKTTK